MDVHLSDIESYNEQQTEPLFAGNIFVAQREMRVTIVVDGFITFKHPGVSQRQRTTA